MGGRTGEAPQDRLSGGGPNPDRGRVADHHVVLLGDQAPPDRPSQRRAKAREGVGLARGGPVQPHLVDPLDPGQQVKPE
jgi:hypothetical protein